MTAKDYLKIWQKLDKFGFVGRFLSPEAKQFLKEKKENPEFKNDNIFSWCIKKALIELEKIK